MYIFIVADNTLPQQPAKIKPLIHNLVDELKRRGYTHEQILGIPEDVMFGSIDAGTMKPHHITGGALYQNIFNIFLAEDNSSDDLDTKKLRAQTRTSALFNEFGIPGHRYWDGLSRAKKKGTHNFVIWNTKKLTVVGVEGDKEAVDYFRNTALQKLTGNPNETYSQTRIDDEAKAWSESVDSFVNGEINRSKRGSLIHVMNTPLVFTLAGMDRLPIEIHISNINKILFKKHHLSPDTLKQIPYALDNTVMIFKSQHDTSKDRDSRVVLTELKEKGADGQEYSIMAAITLGKNNLEGGYAINELTTVYRKDTSSKQQLTPEEDIYNWITRTFKDGTPMNLLLYINKQKARQGAISSGLTPIVFDTLDGLSDSIPDEHDLEKLKNDENFLTSEEVEQYNQDGRHATGHIIENNEFDFDKIGSGEGGAAFGWGAYFHTNPDVGEAYRYYGLPNYGLGTMHVTLNDGSTKDFDDISGYWTAIKRNKEPDIFNIIIDGFRERHGKNYSEVKSYLVREYSALLKNARKNSDTQQVERLKKTINEIKNVKDVTFTNPKRGNIYLADIPENYDLLAWDETFDNQPEHVKKAITKIIEALENMGISSTKLSKAQTGEGLYKAITELFTLHYGEKRYSWHNNTINKKRTSMLFNKFGVSGLRFFDRGSRKTQEGTHNFVIWNEDAIRMVSILHDSDKEAIEYFRKTKTEQEKRSSNTESYNQSSSDKHELPESSKSPVRIFRDTMRRANPKRIALDNLTQDNNGFVRDSTVEKYNQLKTHATGNIIKDNHFDLSYRGSSEGSAGFGYGAYFGEVPEVAEYYRKYGIPNFGRGTLHVITKDGRTFSAERKGEWNNNPNEFLLQALNYIQNFAVDKNNEGIPFDEAIKFIKSVVEAEGKRLAHKKTYSLSREELKLLDDLPHIIKEFDNLNGFNFTPNQYSKLRGNIYTFDIPENDVLLHWNANLDEQNEHVTAALRKVEQAVYDFANKFELDTEAFHDAKTGEELYWGIVDIMEQYLEYETPEDGITEADKRASMLLNAFGIPGHRYYNAFSRQEVLDKYEEYKANHPLKNNGRGYSVAVDADGNTYTANSRGYHSIWSNNPEANLVDVLDQLQRVFMTYRNLNKNANLSLEAAKSKVLSEYDSDIKYTQNLNASKDYIQEQIQEIQKRIQYLNSMTNFVNIL